MKAIDTTKGKTIKLALLYGYLNMFPFFRWIVFWPEISLAIHKYFGKKIYMKILNDNKNGPNKNRSSLGWYEHLKVP